MGLLDMFSPDNKEASLGFALLAAGSPSMRPMGLGERLWGAANNYQEGINRIEDRSLRKQLIEAQAQNYQSEAEARRELARLKKLEQEQQLAQDAYLQRMVSPVSGGEAASLPGGPSPANAELVGQKRPITGADYQQALALRIPPERLKAIAEAPDWGKKEVARMLEVEGPKGEKLLQAVDKFNNPVGSPIPAYMAPQGVPLGNRYEFVKPIAGTTLAMGQSPDSVASNQVAWANYGLGRERLAMDRAGVGPNGEKAPAGYRWAGQNLEGIPGGPADKNALTEAQGKATTFLAQMQDASRTINDLYQNPSKAPGPASIMLTEGLSTNWMAGKEAQELSAAQKQWAESYLRIKTGAAATEGEVRRNVQTFFPQIGDNPETVAQKAAMRLQAERDVAQMTGKGAGKIETPAGASMNIPRRAVNELVMRRADPKARAQFDEVFGAGAADRVLEGM